jgi:hypothetical protein
MKALNIIDATTLCYAQICILIKLLHKHDFTKSLLIEYLNDSKNVKIDLFNDIK